MTEWYSSIEVWAFSSKIGAGKNYLAEQVLMQMLPPKPTLVMELADDIKVDTVVKRNVAFERVFINKDDESRRMLQLQGTEEGRDKYGEDIWINTMGTYMRAYASRGIKRFIIVGVRFWNELRWLHAIGAIIFRVISPSRTLQKVTEEAQGNPEKMQKIMTHLSETNLDDALPSDFDYVLYNEPKDRLKVIWQIKNIIRQIALPKKEKVVIFCDLDDTLLVCNKYYEEIIEHISNFILMSMSIVFQKFNPSDILFEAYIMEEVIKKYILEDVQSYASRYYARDEFSRSLVNVYSRSMNFLADKFFGSSNILEIIDEFENHYLETRGQTVQDYIYNTGMTVYDKDYEPIDDQCILKVLELAKKHHVVIYTLGDYVEQKRKIVNAGLQFLDVEIFSHKDANMVRYLKMKYPAEKYVVIGDSMERDIKCAREADINVIIHVTSEYPFSSINFEDLNL